MRDWLRRKRKKHPRHLAWIRTLPCLCCRRPHMSEAAHVRYSDEEYRKRSVGIGEKPDDEWVVPLCRSCHADQHQHNEREWWEKRGVDPIAVAQALWHKSGDGPWAIDFIRLSAPR
jgi:hypothetical protein